MAYIGNTATTQAFTPAVDYFNGNGSTVAFTLSKPVASVAQVQAVIENVPQNPGSAYTVSGNTITFTSAPPSGTANIYVYYTSPITQVIAPSQGTVSADQIASNYALWNKSGSDINYTAGNVGIGTASPSGRNAGNKVLQVASSTESELKVSTSGNNHVWFAMQPGAGGNNAYISNLDTAGSMIFTVGGYTTERMRIDSSGNVGVGTTSPSQRLDATVGSTTQGSGLAVTNTQAGGYGSGITFYSYRGDGTTKLPAGGISMEGNASWADAGNTSSSMRFYTVNANTYTERMRILSGGQVNIGTGADTNAVFVVNGADTHAINTLRNGTGVSTHIAFRNGNGQVGAIQTSGSSTSYVTSSDYRLKENIAPMTGALATVAQLNPVTYNWKVDGSVGQGFIAHELQAVVPDCVSGEKDAVDADGNPEYQGIDTSFLVATLTKAIQEQQAIIESLTARIEVLEAQ